VNFREERESLRRDEDTGTEFTAAPEAAESGGGSGGVDGGSMNMN
jgi:hypothetical protein